jgi:diguanylate cyclase (GGDEF)-like protein
MSEPTISVPPAADRDGVLLLAHDGPADPSRWESLLAGLLFSGGPLACHALPLSALAGPLPSPEPVALVLLVLSGATPDPRAALHQVQARLPGLPVVVLVHRDDEALALQLIRAGAEDCLPHTEARAQGHALARAVRHALARRRAHTRGPAAGALFRSLVNNSADGMVLVDDRGVVRFANPAARALFAGREADLVGSAFGFRLAAGARVEVELLGAGGTPTAAEMLVAALDWQGRPAFLVTLRDVTPHRRRVADLEQAQRRHQHQACHDPLTGLPNRQLLHDRLQLAAAHARRHQQQVAVLFIDLDGFKDVNDTLGHPAGDVLLQRVAQRLRACVRRASDTVARLGGDEFVVVLGEVNRSLDFALMAQKIVRELGRPFAVDGQDVRVTASIGISLFPYDGADPEALVRKADLAMYKAKRLGKNNCQLFETALDTSRLERLEQEAGLRQALDRGQFLLYYQPQFDLASQTLVGVEALVRWQHPERGLVLPGDFMPLAEGSGLMAAIDCWVLEEACRQGRAWLDDGFAPVPVVVNLSLPRFREPGLARSVARALDEARLPPGQLGLEITESMAMHNREETAATLSELDDLGVQLSIADFGFGYSSLGHLESLPADVLKIDRSVVRPLPEDGAAEALTRSIVGLGHHLGWKVFAEGVETREQVDLLRSLSCDGIQGFYWGEPLPPAHLADLLPRGRSPLCT